MPELQNLGIGDSYSMGGAGIQNVVIGPLHLPVTVEVYAWHNGYKTGEGSTADLTLFCDGAQVASAHDEIFDTYALSTAIHSSLGTGSSASYSISIANRMATMRDFGLKVVVTGVAAP